MRRADTFPHSRQAGVAGVAIVTLILLLMAAMIATTFSINGRVIDDAVNDDQRTQALFLAESGMERAAYRYIAGGVACGALAETAPSYLSGSSIVVNAGDAFNFDGVTPLGAGQCRIRSTGTTASGSVRMVEAILKVNPVINNSSGLQDTTSGNFTVAAGTDVLLVATAWRSAQPVISTIATATYNGVALTPVSSNYSYPPTPSCVSGTCSPLRASAQMWYMVNPPAGTYPLNFTFANAPDVFVKIAFNLIGADTANPVDSYTGGGGLSPASGTPLGVSLSTTKVNDFIIDLIGRDNTGNMNTAGCSSRTVIYDNNATNKIGALSQCGPIASTGPFAMNWTWNQTNKPWATAVVAIKSASGGMLGWREVSVSPP